MPPPLGLDMKTVSEKLKSHLKDENVVSARESEKEAAAGSKEPVKKKKREKREIHVVGSPLWMAPVRRFDFTCVLKSLCGSDFQCFMSF